VQPSPLPPLFTTRSSTLSSTHMCSLAHAIHACRFFSALFLSFAPAVNNPSCFLHELNPSCVVQDPRLKPDSCIDTKPIAGGKQ
jgi:hypothetical protein